MDQTPGTLYIVATPIGNLADISFRAVDILKSVDCVVAEDTRHSKRLLDNYSIRTPMVALHDHNEQAATKGLIGQLQQGKQLALISDAGTPLVSDPGYHLVKESRKRGLRVVAVPGCCAAVAALSVAGLPTNRFVFEGFLSARKTQRTKQLAALNSEPRTLIFYEAPHRIVATLEAMKNTLGAARKAVIVRELTKTYETILSGTLAEIFQCVVQDSDQRKGEIVILVAGCKVDKESVSPQARAVLDVLLAECSVKQAVGLASKITGVTRNKLYECALRRSHSA